MIGITPVTTLGETLFYICRNSDEDSAPIGQTNKTDNLRIIIYHVLYAFNVFARGF